MCHYVDSVSLFSWKYIILFILKVWKEHRDTSHFSQAHRKKEVNCVLSIGWKWLISTGLSEINRDSRLLAVSVSGRQHQVHVLGDKAKGHFLRHFFLSGKKCDRSLKFQNVKVFLLKRLLYMKSVLWFIVSRGIFNQGYRCLKCGLGAHKECLGRLGVCGRTGEMEASPKLTVFHFTLNYNYLEN